MKGIMVSLLIFLTTGIVVGQQSTSNNSVSGNHELPLDILVSAEHIEAFRQGNALVADIKATDHKTKQELDRRLVNGISFFNQDLAARLTQEGKRLSSIPKYTVRPVSKQNGVLRFELSESDFQALENRQLSFDIPNLERGVYRKVEVAHANPVRTSQSFTGGGSSTRTPIQNRVSTDSPFGPRNNQANNSPFILPGPEPNDVDFMGPATPDGWRPTPQTAMYNPYELDEIYRLRNGNGFQQPNFNLPQYEQPTYKPTEKTAYEIEQERNWRANELARQKRQEELQKNEWQRQNDLRIAQQRDQERQAELERQRLAQPRYDLQGSNQRSDGWVLNRNERDSRSFYNQPRTEMAPISTGPRTTQQIAAYNKTDYERMLDQRERDLLNRENQLDLEAQRIAYQQRTLRTSQARDTGITRSTNSNLDWEPLQPRQPAEHYLPTGFTGSVTENAQRRIRNTSNRFDQARNDDSLRPEGADITPVMPNRGIDRFRTAVPPPETNRTNQGASNRVASRGLGSRLGTENNQQSNQESDSDSKINGFVFFLLLCSLGLNFYLAIISRGFYVRYHELADELRETFSATH